MRRWGWSDLSQEDAEKHADERVAQAQEEALKLGWPGNPDLKILRREPKTEYNGAYGVPIREEIVQEEGMDIITRNSYGSLCLNTPDVMIVDVDDLDLIHQFRQSKLDRGGGKVIHAGFFTFITLSIILSNDSNFWQSGLLAWITYLVGVHLVGKIKENRWFKAMGGAVGWLRDKLTEEGGSWALYRTPAGARAIRLDGEDHPDENSSIEKLDRLGSDRNYKALCRKQRCYRARLTPKPWRIDFERWGGPVWPLDEKNTELRKRWVSSYDRARQGWGACLWVEDLGKGETNQRNKTVRDLHDQWALPKDDAEQIG